MKGEIDEGSGHQGTDGQCGPHGPLIAAGPTAEAFTPANLEKAFGGALRHLRLGGADLHDDGDERGVTVITDDERALVLYGQKETQRLVTGKDTAEGPAP
jgi:manganese/iron transport system ATP-binding protein